MAVPWWRNLEKGVWGITVLMLIKYKLINHKLAPILWQWLAPVSMLTSVGSKLQVFILFSFGSYLEPVKLLLTLRVGRGQSHLSLFPTKHLFFTSIWGAKPQLVRKVCLAAECLNVQICSQPQLEWLIVKTGHAGIFHFGTNYIFLWKHKRKYNFTI